MQDFFLNEKKNESGFSYVGCMSLFSHGTKEKEDKLFLSFSPKGKECLSFQYLVYLSAEKKTAAVHHGNLNSSVFDSHVI